jgi:hypothetical protein
MLVLQIYIKVWKIYYKQQRAHSLCIQDSSDYLATGEEVLEEYLPWNKHGRSLVHTYQRLVLVSKSMNSLLHTHETEHGHFTPQYTSRRIWHQILNSLLYPTHIHHSTYVLVSSSMTPFSETLIPHNAQAQALFIIHVSTSLKQYSVEWINSYKSNKNTDTTDAFIMHHKHQISERLTRIMQQYGRFPLCMNLRPLRTWS